MQSKIIIDDLIQDKQNNTKFQIGIGAHRAFASSLTYKIIIKTLYIT